jgi:outer membrane protein OmpA-like peptidoglycan-associated protein
VSIESGQLIAQVQTDADGSYLCTLPCDREYAFMVNKKGYLFHAQRVYLQKVNGTSGIKQDIALSPIQKGMQMILRHVLFETGKYDLLPESVVELDKLVALLKENVGLKIEISGHTDNTGLETANLELSTLRARAVVLYLESKGIPASGLAYKGYGSSSPVAGNDSAEGRQLNRRTEMKILDRL